MKRRPLIVIVHGLPGAGKTRFAEKIGPATGLPVLAKDGVKELLFDTLGIGDLAWSRKMGAASFDILYYALELFLGAQQSVLVEGHFGDGVRASQRLGPAASRHNADLIQILLDVDPKLAAARFHERAPTNERHPGHVEKTGAVPLPNERASFMDLPGERWLLSADEPERIDVYNVIERLKTLVPIKN